MQYIRAAAAFLLMAAGGWALHSAHAQGPGLSRADLLRQDISVPGREALQVRVGEGVFIPAGASHPARNVGPGKASELATYIVRKGAPLVVVAD